MTHPPRITASAEDVYGVFSGKKKEVPVQKEFEVKHWAFMFYGQPFRPPDRTFPVLMGEINGVPFISERLTSFSSATKECKTAAGVVYRLLEIDAHFQEWMKEQDLSPEVFERIIK